MGFQALALIGLFTGVIFLLQLGLRRRDAGLIALFSESLVASLIPLALLAYAIAPSITTGIPIVSAYAPHAYNFIIWPVFALLILRRKFGSKLLIPSLMFVYGLDEIVWNSIAYIRFWGNTEVMFFVLLPYWQTFIVLMAVICIVGYLIVRPVAKPNWYWIAFVAYVLIYAGVYSMPVLQPEVMNGVVVPVANLIFQGGWELSWQAAFLALVYFTFSRRKR